jgi:hypothetical protein
MVISTDGLLRLVKITDPNDLTQSPALTFVGTVSQSDIIQYSLGVEDILTVQAGYVVNYSQNYTVGGELAAGITDEDVAILSKQWYTERAMDTAVQAVYNTYTEPAPVDTMLSKQTEAQAEALRRCNLLKSKRRLVSFQSSTSILRYELGDPVYISHPRFSLSSANSGLGTKGIVVYKQVDWANSRINYKVLI